MNRCPWIDLILLNGSLVLFLTFTRLLCLLHPYLQSNYSAGDQQLLPRVGTCLPSPFVIQIPECLISTAAGGDNDGVLPPNPPDDGGWMGMLGKETQRSGEFNFAICISRTCSEFHHLTVLVLFLFTTGRAARNYLRILSHAILLPPMPRKVT